MGQNPLVFAVTYVYNQVQKLSKSILIMIALHESIYCYLAGIQDYMAIIMRLHDAKPHMPWPGKAISASII